MPRDASKSIPRPARHASSDSWRPSHQADEDRRALESTIRQHGYKSMNELVRWRLYNRTGGGLMAELGSHQLDACSIFLGKEAHRGHGRRRQALLPGRPRDRGPRLLHLRIPGRNYDRQPHARRQRHLPTTTTRSPSPIRRSAPTASSPMANASWAPRGRWSSRSEQNIYLWGGAGRSTAVTATTAGGGPKLDASSSLPTPANAAPADDRALRRSASPRPAAATARRWSTWRTASACANRAWPRDRADLKPRCDGRAAMADAIIALTSNQAMKHQKRIAFEENWFKDDSTSVPDGDMRVEQIT